jgi:hypothetical protein
VLAYYRTQTARLLQNPGAPTSLYAQGDIDSWVNTARGQVAGEAECIRVIGTISTIISQRNYNFSAINIGVPATTGAQGVIHVRRINYGVASGQKWVTPRAWPWFDQFYLNNPVPVNGFPKQWAQYGQGGAGVGSITGVGGGTMSSGSFYLDPPPDAVYTLYCDCVCYPIALAADTDVEALPYLFTDAVPFFAAYYALLSSQTSSRQADAARMMENYNTFLGRARQASNPSVLRSNYEQSVDPRQASKLGIGKQAAG